MASTSNPVGFCGSCGLQLNAGQKFCPRCGAESDLSDSLQNSPTPTVTALKSIINTLKTISKPQQFKGHGQKVSPKFTLHEGLVVFRMTHNGRRNFIIWLLDQQGHRVAILVNRVGNFNGSKGMGINRAGIHLLDIAADGNWTVKIEQS